MIDTKVSYDHFVKGEIFSEILAYTKKHSLGRVIMGPIDVRLQDQARVIQPDIIFLSNDKWEHEFDILQGVPDLVVEILDLNSYRVDRVVKFITYEQVGVKEYWIVNPKAKTIEVYTLDKKEYVLAGSYVYGEELRSPLFDKLILDTELVFGQARKFSMNGAAAN